MSLLQAGLSRRSPVLLPAPAAAHGQGIMGTAPRTVPVAVAVEDRLQFLFQQHGRCCLRDPVGRVRDGAFILPLLQSVSGCVALDLAGQAGTGGSGEVSMPGGTGIVVIGARSWRAEAAG
jgi:hypothetical protein